MERQSRSVQRTVTTRSMSTSNLAEPVSHFVPDFRIPVHRSRSSSNFKEYNEIVADKFRPTPYLSKYNRSRNPWSDEYGWDRFGLCPKFWPNQHQRVRRYAYKDPSYNYYFYYPALSLYPKYQRMSYQDNLDPRYWRRYRDPYYSQPLWFPYRPWVYESQDTKRAVDMYRKKLITYDSLQKYWVTPGYSERKYSDTSYAYRPVFWHTYPRNYSYFYDVSY